MGAGRLGFKVILQLPLAFIRSLTSSVLLFHNKVIVLLAVGEKRRRTCGNRKTSSLEALSVWKGGALALYSKLPSSFSSTSCLSLPGQVWWWIVVPACHMEVWRQKLQHWEFEGNKLTKEGVGHHLCNCKGIVISAKTAVHTPVRNPSPMFLYINKPKKLTGVLH